MLLHTMPCLVSIPEFSDIAFVITSVAIFAQFAWRPRPKPLLTDDERKEVTKNLKKYMQRYEKEDAVRRKRINAAANAEKLRQLTDFRGMLDRLLKSYEDDVQNRYATGIWVKSEEEEFTEVEETVEEVLSEKTAPYVP